MLDRLYRYSIALVLGLSLAVLWYNGAAVIICSFGTWWIGFCRRGSYEWVWWLHFLNSDVWVHFVKGFEKSSKSALTPNVFLLSNLLITSVNLITASVLPKDSVYPNWLVNGGSADLRCCAMIFSVTLPRWNSRLIVLASWFSWSASPQRPFQ